MNSIKKSIVLVLLWIFCLSTVLNGCADGTDSETPNGGSSNEEVNSSVGDDVNSGTSTGSDFTGGEPDSAESLGIRGVTIAIHSDVAPVLAALGDDYEYRESDSCAFVGKDKQYIYNGFVIFTYPDGTIDRISTVALTSDAVTTDSGLYIGASVSKAKAVYGDALVQNGDTYSLETDRVQILILSKDGEITSLQYIAKYN